MGLQFLRQRLRLLPRILHLDAAGVGHADGLAAGRAALGVVVVVVVVMVVVAVVGVIVAK